MTKYARTDVQEGEDKNAQQGRANARESKSGRPFSASDSLSAHPQAALRSKARAAPAAAPSRDRERAARPSSPAQRGCTCAPARACGENGGAGFEGKSQASSFP
eukprot:6187744-Pleurochrysis_carterae.AAC.2